MLIHTHANVFDRRVRWLLIGGVGLLVALLTTRRIVLPTVGLLTQFFLFSPLVRATLMVRLLSPALIFVLAGGGMWVLLRLAESLCSLQRQRTLPERRDAEPCPWWQQGPSTVGLESVTSELVWGSQMKLLFHFRHQGLM